MQKITNERGLSHFLSVRWLAALALIWPFSTSPAIADIIDIGPWRVQSDFKNSRASLNISGAVCPTSRNASRLCLAINDEKRYIQFFSLGEKTIAPQKRLWLLPKENETRVKFKDMDAEAVAYFGGYVYVTGSHGLTRKKSKMRSSQFYVFRFPVSLQTGKPDFENEKKKVSTLVQRSDKLGAIIEKQPALKPFFKSPLRAGGANIEGMVVDGENMYFGFRGPNVDSNAFVLSVNESAIFGGKPAQPKLHKLLLSDGVGIRDLTMTSNAILVLAGPVNGEGGNGFSIYLWEPVTGKLGKLGDLAMIAGGKPEGLLLLSETEVQARRTFNILIFHDGLKNGAPQEYQILLDGK